MRASVPARPRPLPSVRASLLWMVLACFLPGLLGGALLLAHEYQEGRAQLQANTLQTARAMVQAVDAQLAQGELLAKTLATSDALTRRDFATFHQRAQRLLRDAHFVQTILIYDAAGQQIVNARLPWGEPLPRREDLGQIQRVFAEGKPAPAEVLLSPLTHLPVVGIAAPVFSGTRVDYVLVIGISADIFGNILRKQGLSPDWVTAIFDSTGTIAAGSHDITTQEGIPTVSPYSRSAQSGWSVAVGIPRSGLETGLRKNLLLLAAGTGLLLAMSMGLVWYFGGRIAAALLALRTAATALGQGGSVDVPPLHLREADEVAQAMAHAALVLEERDHALHMSHQALVAQEAELLDAQRIAKIGSWSWDKQTDVIWGSQEMCRIFGLQEIPPFARQDGLMFTHEVWLEVHQARLDTERTGQGYHLELPALHADGRALWVATRAEAIYDAAGNFVGLRGMVQDVTERKRQMGELNAVRTEMQTMMEWQVARHTVAALAHEINQPLASLSALCEAASRMLQANGPNPVDGARLLQTLQRMASETERAGAVVRQLVQSVSQPHIALGPVALNELLHDVAKMVADEGALDCQIQISCPTHLKPVTANYLQITKVLMNLIGNAAQAMAAAHIARGRIWIGATPTEDQLAVDISVRDEGPGIRPALAEHIFQPFVTTKSDGLGMGLTISRALVEAHGGKLWLEPSTGPGATFHFTLPFVS